MEEYVVMGKKVHEITFHLIKLCICISWISVHSFGDEGGVEVAMDDSDKH